MKIWIIMEAIMFVAPFSPFNRAHLNHVDDYEVTYRRKRPYHQFKVDQPRYQNERDN